MKKYLGFIYALILFFIIATPTLRMSYYGGADGKLYGYVTDVSPKPKLITENFLNKSIQKWSEAYFNFNFGFKEVLVRSFNEVIFNMFGQIPHLNLYSTSSNGLYSSMAISHMNTEVQNFAALELFYRSEAEKLLLIQHYLESKGKIFIVIVASSKAYIYPEALGNKYILGGTRGIDNRIANFGTALKNIGVNSIDSRPMLKEFLTKSGISTHANSGVHWNYYAGCIVAQEITHKAREKFSNVEELGCGFPEYLPPRDVDLDGLNLLNIWSGGGLKKMTPYPTIYPQSSSKKQLSYLMIGDSFSDQINKALIESSPNSKLVAYPYFKTRQEYFGTLNFRETLDKDSSLTDIGKQFFLDLEKNDVVILEVVDYQTTLKSFGFTDFLLRQEDFIRFVNQFPKTVTAKNLQLEKVCCLPDDRLKVLALIDDVNMKNPFLINSNIRFVKTLSDLLDLVLISKPELIAVTPPKDIGLEKIISQLKNQGYVVLVDSKEFLFFYDPFQIELETLLSKQNLKWGTYNVTPDVNISYQENLPILNAKTLVDAGVFTQELEFNGPTIVIASFSGTLEGEGERAGLISILGNKPLINLTSGNYSIESKHIVIFPQDSIPKKQRIGFGLGGWAKGQGNIKLSEFSVLKLVRKNKKTKS